MLKLQTRPQPIKTIGQVVLIAAGLVAATLLAMQVGRMIWHRFGFEAFGAFLVAYCVTMMVVIIRL